MEQKIIRSKSELKVKTIKVLKVQEMHATKAPLVSNECTIFKLKRVHFEVYTPRHMFKKEILGIKNKSLKPTSHSTDTFLRPELPGKDIE